MDEFSVTDELLAVPLMKGVLQSEMAQCEDKDSWSIDGDVVGVNDDGDVDVVGVKDDGSDNSDDVVGVNDDGNDDAVGVIGKGE